MKLEFRSCFALFNYLRAINRAIINELIEVTMTSKTTTRDVSALATPSNFLRQFRDVSSRQFRKFTATQFLEVWNHYDSDGQSEYIVRLSASNHRSKTVYNVTRFPRRVISPIHDGGREIYAYVCAETDFRLKIFFGVAQQSILQSSDVIFF
jgi:hypothetical protein